MCFSSRGSLTAAASSGFLRFYTEQGGGTLTPRRLIAGCDYLQELLSGADVRNTFRHLFSVPGLTIKVSAQSAAIFTAVYTAHLLSDAAGGEGM